MPRRRYTVREAPLIPLTPGDEVWGYIRVSSDTQARKGLPVASMEAELRAYCATHAYRLTRVYTDEAESATTDERDAFRDMAEEAQESHPAGIVMWDWTRFSRDQRQGHYWLAVLSYAGINLVVIHETVPTMPGMEWISRSVALHYAEHQSKLLGQAIKRSHRALAKRGLLPAGDYQLPRGYRSVQVPVSIGKAEHTARRIELDPDQAPLVRQSYDMRLAGATFEQIKAATGLYSWPNDYGDMFRNPAYKGTYCWGDIEIEVPAIVSEHEWQRVYDGLAKGRGGAYPRQKASIYLLTGLVHCGICSSPMRGHSCSHDNKTWYYYRCFTPHCQVESVRKHDLESGVIAMLLDEVLTPARLARIVDVASRDHSIQDAKTESLRREITRRDKAIANLVAALELADDGRELAARLKLRTQERKDLERQLQEAERPEQHLPQQADFERLREWLATGIETNPQAAKEAIATVVEAVVVRPEGWEVKLRLPFAV